MTLRDVILLMIAISLAWGLFVMARRGGRSMVGYTTLLGANLLLVVMLIVSGTSKGPAFHLAVACFLLLVIVPAVLRGGIRRAMARDRFDLALRLARARELLLPGAGGSRERVMLNAVVLARQGKTKEAVDSLETWAAKGGPDRLLEAQEQIVAILSMERRFEEAIAYGQALGEMPTHRPMLAAGLARAFVEVGDLERAATMLRHLEEGPAGSDPAGSDLVNQARLYFLAHAGEADAVAYLLSPDSGFLPSLPDKIRAYWRGVALMRAGRADEGRAELLRAQALADPSEDRFRAAIRDRIARGAGEPASEDVIRYAREVGVRAQVHRAVPRGGRILRVAPVTVGLAAAIIAVWALVEIGGSSGDTWMLIRAGALFKPAVGAGDLWRTVSATFLHGGLLHLCLNAYGLILFGRLVERVYGSPRFFILYVASGVAGFVASYLFGRATLSVGASGCIFGLLGAAIAVLLLRRRQWPEGWRRGALTVFAFIAVANIVIGFSLPMIDNAAHLGGLASGFIIGLALVPGGIMGSGALSKTVVALLTLLAAGLVAYGVVGTLATDPESLLTRLPTGESALVSESDGALVRHPAYWMTDPRGLTLIDPAGGLGMLVQSDSTEAAERAFREQLPEAPGMAVACRTLKPGLRFCFLFRASGRVAYLPALDVLAASARPIPE